MIYVPSKARAGHVEKNLQSWLSTGMEVKVVVEPEDADEYREVIKGRAKLLLLADSNRGISFARNSIIKHANRNFMDRIIMCDDDYQTSPGVAGLIKDVKDLRLSGMGGYVSIYGHFLRIKPDSGIHILNGGMGQQVVSLCPQDVLDVGGYNEEVKTHDDTFLRIKLQLAGKGEWAVHSGAHITNKGKRYGPGGIQASVGDKEGWEKAVTRDSELFQEAFGDKIVTLVRSKSGHLTMRINWRVMYRQIEEARNG